MRANEAMVDQSIIDRIHKLNVLANAAGTEHEAANAATRVREMLDKYNLELGEVELAAHPAEEQDACEPLRKRPHHYHFLMNAAQTLFGVGGYWLRCLYPRKSKPVMVPIFYGSKSNVSAAVVSFRYFIATVDELYRAHLKKPDTGSLFRMTRVSARAFKLGAAEQINILVAKHLSSMAVSTDTKAIVKVTDAIVIRHTERLKSSGMAWEAEEIPFPGDDLRAYQAGKRAGNSVDIHGTGKRLTTGT